MINEKLIKIRGWRKLAVVGGSLAVLAVGAAGTTQAFADQGSEAHSPGRSRTDGQLRLYLEHSERKGRAKRTRHLAVLDSTGSDALTPTADTSRTKAKASEGAGEGGSVEEGGHHVAGDGPRGHAGRLRRRGP